MSASPHDMTKSRRLQAAQPADEWTAEVVTRLPETLAQQAKALKAFERSRQIRSAADLLRGLLAYVYTTHSFVHLSMWSVLIGLMFRPTTGANACSGRAPGAIGSCKNC